MSRSKYPPLVHVSGIGLADAWQQLVKECMEKGMLKRRFYGKPVNTYDVVSLTEIRYPLLEPMLHPQFPTKELHVKEYLKQWERDYDWRKQGFEYNYGNRLRYYPKTFFSDVPEKDYYDKAHFYGEFGDFIDQLDVLRNRIANKIEKGGECLVSNRDEAITWIPNRDLFVPEDQPCLQRIQIFVYDYPRWTPYNERYTDTYDGKEIVKGKAEFHCMWRSRDLFTAWNSNMIGLIKMMNKEIFEPNNLELVRVIDFCNSLHIYESDWEAASKIKMISVNPQFMR